MKIHFRPHFVYTLAASLAIALLASIAPIAQAGTIACTSNGYTAMGGMVFQTTNGYLLASWADSPDTGGMATWGYAWLKFDAGQLPTEEVASATMKLQSITQTTSMWTAPEDAPVDTSVFTTDADVAAITDGTAADAFRANILSPAVSTTLVIGGEGFYEWDVTDVVNGWITSGNNYGLVLATSGGAISKFHSAQTTTGTAPVIEFTAVPEPGMAILALSAFGLFACGRRQRRNIN